MMQIVIYYPPYDDGCLEIECEVIPRYKHPDEVGDYKYSFTHYAKGDEWETLVAAAKAVLAQDDRMKITKASRGNPEDTIKKLDKAFSNG